MPSCTRFEYIPASGTKYSECPPDFTIFVEVLYKGNRGWLPLQYSDTTDSRVAYCPADGCPAQGERTFTILGVGFHSRFVKAEVFVKLPVLIAHNHIPR